MREHATLENCDVYPLPRVACRLSSGGDSAPWWADSKEDDEVTRVTGPHLGFTADDETRHLAQAFITGAPVGSGPFCLGHMRKTRTNIWNDTLGTIEEAYDRGWQAYEAGKAECPYHWNSTRGHAWNAGYIDNREAWYGRSSWVWR